jgi:hypothetical protein
VEDGVGQEGENGGDVLGGEGSLVERYVPAFVGGDGADVALSFEGKVGGGSAEG